jgi:hypothetical protein
MKISFLFFISFLSVKMLVAQDIAGRWEGYLDHSKGASVKDGYKNYWERGTWKEGTKTQNVELTLLFNNKKKAYTGEYYTEDATKKTHYARFAVLATVDNNGGIYYKTTSKIFETKNQLNQGFCFNQANLTRTEDKKYVYLEGTWKSWDNNDNQCLPAHIWIRRKKRFKDNLEPVVALVEKIDTVVEMNSITPPKPKDTLVVQKQEPLVSKPAYSDRKLVTKETIHVPKDSIWIQVSDSNREDGDVISLEFNGQLLIKKYTLRTTKKGFRVRLQPGVNILTLIAHNLGEIPPNTAALEIERTEGWKRIILESDMDTSESIQIIKE